VGAALGLEVCKLRLMRIAVRKRLPKGDPALLPSLHKATAVEKVPKSVSYSRRYPGWCGQRPKVLQYESASGDADVQRLRLDWNVM
jgi:hypothetical protein